MKAFEKVVTLPGPQLPTADEVFATVDEFGRLDETLRAPNARHELLRKRILGWHTDLPPGHHAAESGAVYTLEITPKAIKREVTGLAKLQKAIGLKAFIGICKVTLDALSSVMHEDAMDEFITADRTGGRRIVVTRRFEEAA